MSNNVVHMFVYGDPDNVYNYNLSLPSCLIIGQPTLMDNKNRMDQKHLF